MAADIDHEVKATPKRWGHRDLVVWQKACDLVVVVYKITGCFPTEERYGLTSQMRRCAASVPANIAEGAARRGAGEFQHFLSIARGSLAELDTWVEVSERVGLITREESDMLAARIDELAGMVVRLRQSISPGQARQEHRG